MIDSHNEDHKATRDAAPDAELKRLIEQIHRRMKWTLIAATIAAILSAITIVAATGFFMMAGSGGD
jgi:hypothetical protein